MTENKNISHTDISYTDSHTEGHIGNSGTDPGICATVGVEIEVRVPGLLRDCTDQQARFTLRATTLAHAVERLLAVYPRLRVHLYTEQGELRRHILLFYNQTNFKELESLDLPLQPGDRLSVVQAVSGGRA
jgi:molybdopterin converting factor small subunit